MYLSPSSDYSLLLESLTGYEPSTSVDKNGNGFETYIDRSPNGSNYAIWKVQFTMALKKDGVWGIVSGTKKAPEDNVRERERFTIRKHNLAEWRNSSDSESDVVGLVTCQALSAMNTNEADSWIIDSGATCHICDDR